MLGGKATQRQKITELWGRSTRSVKRKREYRYILACFSFFITLRASMRDFNLPAAIS